MSAHVSAPACDECAELGNTGLCQHYGCDLCGSGPTTHTTQYAMFGGERRLVPAALCADCLRAVRDGKVELF